MRRVIWVGAGVVLVAGAGLVWYLRRPKPVPAPVSAPTEEEKTKIAKPGQPPAVLTDARIATWSGSAMGEQATLLIQGTALMLPGPSGVRLRLFPDLDVTLATRIGNGTDQDLDVVLEAELITDTGELVARFWVGEVWRVQVRIPAHQVATVEWSTVRPGESLPAGRDVGLVIAVSAQGRTVQYRGTLLRTETRPVTSPPTPQGPVLVSPPVRWERLERI